MPTLQQLALTRLRLTGLPEFLDGTLVDRMNAAREAARAVLQQYVPTIKIDKQQAQEVMSQVNAWVYRHENNLSEAMSSPATNLPNWLALNMGSKQIVRQWLLANYAEAAEGMGPWRSGDVDEQVADPNSNISKNWAEEDAQMRIDSFAMIVKMHQDGDLARLFSDESTSGFGAIPALLVWGFVVAVVALAAVVVTYFYFAKSLELNNKLLAQLCLKAQQEKKEATVRACIEATKEIQIQNPLSKAASTLTTGVLAIGAGWLAIKYGLPALTKGRHEKRSRSTAT